MINEWIISGKSKKHVEEKIKETMANYLFNTGCDISECGDFSALVENFAKYYLKCFSLEEGNEFPYNPTKTYHGIWEIYQYSENYKNINRVLRVRSSWRSNLTLTWSKITQVHFYANWLLNIPDQIQMQRLKPNKFAIKSILCLLQQMFWISCKFRSK